jgi:hypothetical protein
MVLRHYPQVPPSAMLDFGGYRLVKPAEWEDYLDSLIQTEYPSYYKEHYGRSQGSELWRKNACILESLEKYLFSQYGVSIPQDNLFKVYNQAGEGIEPEQLIESITAVIEPLGFEVERVIVPDAELRNALGDSQRTVDLGEAAFFEGQPGVCMINISPGESHAFFWERMDTRRFNKEQFRMALCLKPKESISRPAFSAIQSVDIFCGLVKDYLDGQRLSGQNDRDVLQGQVLSESESLKRYVHNPRSLQGKRFHKHAAERVSVLVELLKTWVNGNTPAAGEEKTLLQAGELICRIFKDSNAVGQVQGG